MKRMKALVLALVMILSLCATALPQGVFAAEVASGTCGDNLTWVLDDEGTLTVSGTGAMKNYEYSSKAPWYSNRDSIKAVVIEDGVTSIGDSAFRDCTSLTSVTIGDSVTSIGYCSFECCDSLTSVTIPDSVTSIGASAFYSCTSLTSVTIPDSVTSIGDSAFYKCTSLEYNMYDNANYLGNSENPYLALITCTSKDITSCEIHGNTRVIYSSAFSGCSSLESITIPDSVISIGDDVFWDCSSLESITIPDSVTSIGDTAFYNCTSLTSVTIGDGVTSIDHAAFFGCKSLTGIWVDENNAYYSSDNYGVLFNKDKTELIAAPGAIVTYTIPDSVTSIGSSAFEGCKSLTSVTIGDSVTSIGDAAFHNCTNLTSVTIGNGVTSIGDYAFEYCTSLKSITIPDSVTSVGYRAFYNCTSLEYNVYDNAKYLGNSENPYLALITYTTSSITSCEIHEDTKVIADFAFCSCDSLTSVTIGNGVTSIGRYAFENCTGLTSVTIGDSVTSIGGSAFYNCTSLNAVYITDIAAWCGIVFGNASGNPLYYAGNLYLNGELVTDLVIPDGVTSIGDCAFYKCTSLTSVAIGNGVTSIGGWAFLCCSSLESITIPDSITSVGYRAFYNCTSLEYNVYDNAKYLGNSENPYLALITYTSQELTSCEIHEDAKVIGDSAFYKCTSLTSVTIGDSVASIGEGAFYNCTSLNAVYVTDIAAWCGIAFDISISNPLYYAGNLYLNGKLVTDLAIPDSVTSIGNYAFFYCTSLESITIPDSVTSIGGYAFRYCTSLTEICFEGDAPTFGKYYVFGNVTATAYYPAENETWTEDVRKNYGGTITWVAYEVEEEATAGDANGDETINHLDAMLIAQYYVGAIGEDAIVLSAADVNGDGVINHLDAMMVAQFYVGAIDRLG